MFNCCCSNYEVEQEVEEKQENGVEEGDKEDKAFKSKRYEEDKSKHISPQGIL